MKSPGIVSRRSLLLLLVTSILLVPVALLQAQETEGSAPTYDLYWWTVDGGGSTGPASSPSYSLVGTTGQADAGQMEGPRYGLAGGFWAVAPAGTGHNHHIYLPLVVRNTS